jgi:hypothetical protein
MCVAYLQTGPLLQVSRIDTCAQWFVSSSIVRIAYAQTYPCNLQISMLVANALFVPSNQTLTFLFLVWAAPIQIGVCLIILIF